MQQCTLAGLEQPTVQSRDDPLYLLHYRPLGIKHQAQISFSLGCILDGSWEHVGHMSSIMISQVDSQKMVRGFSTDLD